MSAAVASLPVVRAPEEALARYGKTFRWATFFLGARTARTTRAFYALCRYADDLADLVGGVSARRHLIGLRTDLERGTSTAPAVAAFLQATRNTALDLRPVHALVRAVEQDLEPARIGGVDELLRYAHGVAGTVGLVMCDLFGAGEERARPFAVDLGIAMQLTNIARDVLEDARNGRVYLPAELLGRPVDPEELVADSGDARTLAHAAVLRLLNLAGMFYRSADRGMRYLPFRARAAVLTASHCYEAIGDEIRRAGPRYWEGRAFVGKVGKVRHTLRALLSLAFDPKHAVPHEPRLHRSLRGRIGADPEA